MTRRELLTLGLGAAAAVPFTPVPWKLLDDTAKWTQNWALIPRPPQGERSVRYSSCTLCAAGCGIAARCVGANVVGIAPVPEHPVSKGVLCPVAFGAHQLPFHPARITCLLRRGTPVQMEKAAAEIGGRIKSGRFAIVDERPGRAVSEAYRRLAAANNGLYVAGREVREYGLALEQVRTIVSFGVPVLESWATPGRVLELWSCGRLAIVQVERSLSKTGALASKTLLVRPGSESFVAALLEGKVDRARAARETGIAQEKLDDAARFVRDRGPMIAVNEPAASVTQSVAQLNKIGDGELDTVLIDHGLLGGSLEIDAIRAKLRPGGVIVSFSPYRAGVAAGADFVIPTAAFGEALEEAPTPWDAIVPSYALAPALRNAPAGVTSAIDFLERATGDSATRESAIQRRVEKLHAAQRGVVFAFADRSVKPMGDFKTPADLRKAFDTGACWTDAQAKTVPVNYRAATDGSSAVAPPLFGMFRRFGDAS
jgi:hypothetical protein